MARGPTDFSAPPTVQENVLAELRRELLAGDLRPGEEINQEHVAARLGVSAIPVREALRMLEGQGLVVYRARRRYTVAELSIADVHELFLVRDQLEGIAISWGVRDNEQISLAHRDFMFAIFEASGMRLLLRILNNLWDTIDPYRSLFVQKSFLTHSARADLVVEKRAILAAVESRNVPTVLGIVRRINERTLEQIVAALESD